MLPRFATAFHFTNQTEHDTSNHATTTDQPQQATSNHATTTSNQKANTKQPQRATLRATHQNLERNEMQAGEERKAGESPTFEQLLEAASRGRSKYDAVADKIELLRAGGVTLRAIASWVEAQGIKSEVGELGQWLKRRRARQEKLMAGASEVARQSSPQAAPKAVQAATPTPSTTMKPNPSPSVFRSSRAPDPSDRPGTSEREKAVDALIEQALAETRAKNSPFKSKAAGK